MVFNSAEFFVFLAIVLVLYYSLNQRWQNLLLFVSSYIFYGWWDWRFTLLLFTSTLIDYVCGLRIPGKNGKAWLWASIVGQLLLLGCFKYLNFFRDSLAQFLGMFGITPGWSTLHILLPVGISFYTFQTLSYTIDIWRGRVKPVRNFIDFAVFVSFWPHLVAGPILRARFLLPQIQSKRTVTSRNWSAGTYFILVGLVKKVVVADLIASVATPFLRNPSSGSSTTLAVLFFLCYMRIYCDFAGYTDIARGSALLLGFRLVENFRYPYLSRSIQEFWTRWHMSLSSWMRDYVYRSLGGGHRGVPWMYLNLVITMLLCGLWHGASWTFVIWGVLNGVYLAVGHAIAPAMRGAERMAGRIGMQGLVITLRVVILQTLWALTGVFFVQPTVKTAVGYMTAMCTGGTYTLDPNCLKTLLFVTPVLMLCDLPEYFSGTREYLADRPWLIRSAVYALFITLLIATWTKDYDPFVYFQF
jgi:alginate O-acetyltransferase complex protein AlgI